jgi:DGQHR domain-containing protein
VLSAAKAVTAPVAKTFPAMSYKQRGEKGPQLVVFVAPVKEILRFATVDALSPSARGPQREQKEARVDAISRFLSADAQNTIPTAVILAFAKGMASFRPSISAQMGELRIRGGQKHAATIVDGQHRLFGINLADPDMEVGVVGIIDASPVERAFQFLVINNKSSKVPPTHTKALLAKMKNTDLPKRLLSAKLAFDIDGINDIDLVNSDKDSPFYQTIDWTTTPIAKRMVQATSIELSLAYLESLGLPDFDDRDVRRSVFLVIWRTIKNHWSELWTKDSRLVSKVGVVCMTRYISNLITSWADNEELDITITDLEQIEKQTEKIIQHMNKDFWTTPWAEKAQGGFDTNQGRDRVLQALTQLYRNGKRGIAWWTDIEIIDRSLAKPTARKKDR